MARNAIIVILEIGHSSRNLFSTISIVKYRVYDT